MGVLKIIGIVLFLLFCLICILFDLWLMLVFIAMDREWWRRWPDKEDR